MGSFDFALERPRRIRISIEGYNPEVQRQAQLRRQQKRKRRLQHEAQAAARQPAPEAALRPSFVDAARQGDGDALEALTRAAAARPLLAEVENELRAVFADEPAPPQSAEPNPPQ